MSEGGGGSAAAIEQLDAITRRLRRECPWDREQDERSIVPHTIEEAYELADAAHGGDDAKLLDELGDVLFQVMFLSLLLEERSAGDLSGVAEHCRQKLIRRHPHVFGDVEADSADAVLRNWDEIKRTTEGRGAGGIFADVPENLPSLLYARKALRRAGSAGRAEPEGVAEALARLRVEMARLEGEATGDREGQATAGGAREGHFAAVGDTLFAAVAAARALDVDPELALRASADRFKHAIEEEAPVRE